MLRNTLAPAALPGREPAGPTAGSAEPVTAASAALAAARQQRELSFSDAALGAQAAAWRRRQQQALGALGAALQGPDRDGSGGGAAAPRPTHLAVQAVPYRLMRLQLDNAQCVRQLHGLHMQQMQRHLEEAARLKGPAAAQAQAGAAAGGSGLASGTIVVKAEHSMEQPGPQLQQQQQQAHEAVATKQEGEAGEPPPWPSAMPTLTALQVMSLGREQPGSDHAGKGDALAAGLELLQG